VRREQGARRRAIRVVASLDDGDTDAAGDAAAVAGSLSGPEMFAVIFDRHFDTVYRYVARRIGAGPAAEDVTAEAFAVAFSRRGMFYPARGRCRNWLLGIAANVLRRYYRSEKRRLVAMARLGPEVIVAARDEDGHDLWGDAGGVGRGRTARRRCRPRGSVPVTGSWFLVQPTSGGLTRVQVAPPSAVRKTCRASAPESYQPMAAVTKTGAVRG
jgi:hypothetical protein